MKVMKMMIWISEIVIIGGVDAESTTIDLVDIIFGRYINV